MPDSLQWMREGSAGTSQGPRGQSHVRDCRLGERGAVAVTAAAPRPGLDRLLQGFFSGY